MIALLYFEYKTLLRVSEYILMDNNDLNARTAIPSRSVVSYRPERPGYEFQRTEAVATPVQPLAQQAMPVAQSVPATAPAMASVAADPVVLQQPAVNEVTKKPFTLAKAIIVFIAVGVGAAAGYIGYSIWIGQ
jgi:hypothetical protein